MTALKVVLIPSDALLPVQEVEYDQSDYRNLTALIFNGNRDGTFDCFSMPDADGNTVTFWFDDDGLARLEGGEEMHNIVNLRAMELVAKLKGCGVGDLVPLIGDYVITGGADSEGDSLAAPEWIKDHGFTWHQRYSIRRVN